MIESRYPLRPLGEVLELDRQEVPIDPTQTYRTAGIYSFGRGLFEREPILGSETAYKSLFRLSVGQVAISRLNGWEGALDVVSPEMDGAHVSNEYPTFSIIEREASVDYLTHLIHWPPLWDAMRPRGSMVRRRRVHPDDFLTIEVPLPSLSEQTRAAARLEALLRLRLAATTHSIGQARTSTGSVLLAPGLTQLVPADSPRVLISELVDIVSDVVHPGDDPLPARSFVGLQHIEPHTGRRIGAAPLGEDKGRKFRFRPGDVVYGYLRPYLNKVWLADRHGLCSVDQYVLRPKQPDDAALIACMLRTSHVLEQAIALTHSLSLPRLRSGLLLGMTTFEVKDAKRRVTERRAEALTSAYVKLVHAHKRRMALLDALQKSILNQAFAGLL